MNIVEVEQRGYVKIVTLNRPDTLNAISIELSQRLHKIIDDLMLDKETRVVIITGRGRAFSAGADLKQRRSSNAEEKWRQTLTIADLFDRLEMVEVPVIAAVNGFALGGGFEMALACDMRIASNHSLFGLPEINLASFPGAGAPTRLPRMIGMGKAKELLFTGRRIPATEAERIGLVEKVVPAEKVLEEAIALAEEIAQNGPLAVRALKKAINYGLRTYPELSFKISHLLRKPLDTTKDYEEGLRAFVEKRKPAYIGE